MPEETVRRLDGFRDRLLGRAAAAHPPTSRSARLTALRTSGSLSCAARSSTARASGVRTFPRSEEHTSELQSRLHLVCRLLLEKKNTHQRVLRSTGSSRAHRRASAPST